MQNCTIDCIQVMGNFSRGDTCDFVRANCEQGTVQAVQGYYCLMGESFILLILLLSLALLMIYYALQHLTGSLLAPTVEEFIHTWHVSDALAGITFLSFANGAPDIVTAIIAGSSSSESTVLIPFGSLYGAAIFEMVIYFSIILEMMPKTGPGLKPKEVLLPLCFYIGGTLYLLLISLFYKKMNLGIAAAFLGLYAIYILIVIVEEKRKHKKVQFNAEQSLLELEGHQENEENEQEIKTKNQSDSEVKLDVEQVEKDKPRTNNPLQLLTHYIRLFWTFIFNYSVPPYNQESWQPLRAVISLILAPFICLLAYGPHNSLSTYLLGIPPMVWFSTLALLFLLHTILCIATKRKPQTTILYSVYAFAIVVVWLIIICSTLINLLELLQLLTNVNPVFLGLSVIGWANCVGDYFSITAFAKKGYASTAISGIFSGQLTNFLVGFGLSLLIRSTRGEYKFALFQFTGSAFTRISGSILLVVIGMVTAYMCWLAYQLITKRGQFGVGPRRVAKIYYVVFFSLALVLSVCTDYFRQISCDM